jgi:hypothetical protein
MKAQWTQIKLGFDVGRHNRIGGINGLAFQWILVATVMSFLGSVIWLVTLHPCWRVVGMLTFLVLFEAIWMVLHVNDVCKYTDAMTAAADHYYAERRAAKCQS